MPDTPPRMDREKLAVVVEENGFYQAIIPGSIRGKIHATNHLAIHEANSINAAASAWLDREFKKAVEAERLACADFVRHIHGEGTLADELEKRPEIERGIRSAPGQEKCLACEAGVCSTHGNYKESQ